MPKLEPVYIPEPLEPGRLLTVLRVLQDSVLGAILIAGLPLGLIWLWEMCRL